MTLHHITRIGKVVGALLFASVIGLASINSGIAFRSDSSPKRSKTPVLTPVLTEAPQKLLKAVLLPMVPPPPPDSDETSGFKKLIVKNLGPILNSSVVDFAPTVTADGRTMFFVTRREGSLKGTQDFWRSTSPENDDTTWGAPSHISTINSEQSDGAASIAADGQTIYMATDRNTTEKGDINIWVATLDGTEWKNVREVGPPINTTAWESQPSISADGKKLFFASNRPGKPADEDKGNIDIFVSKQLADGRWSEPVNLGATINTGEYDASPFIAADGTTLYFCSDGRSDSKKKDIYKAEWIGPSDQDWSTPVRLPEPINSDADDFFLTVPASGNVMYFTSSREGGSGSWDIYVAFNPPPPKATLVLRGVAYDINTNAKLGAHVVVVDEQTGDTLYNKQANTESGEYLCVIPANAKGECGGSFLVSATEANHFPYPPTRVTIPLRNDTSRIVTHDIPMNNEEPPIVKWVTEEPGLVKELPGKFANYKGVIIREKQTIELFPLLPKVFYDEGQGTFPSRYVLFSSPSETEGFTEDTVTSTFNGYWNYLNILGYRLRKHPDVKVKIVGCNSMDVAAEKSIELSRQRAESVKKYLVDIWGIDPVRLPIEARNLPENSTLATTPEGIEENRRVDIQSEDWDIIKPIKFQTLVKYPDFRTVKFALTNGLRLENIEKRELVITHNGQEWSRMTDLGDLSSTMSPEWNWRTPSGKLPEDETDMSVQLFITDKTGRVVPSNIDNTNVRQFTQKDVTAERLADKTRETYNLILFQYNSAQMGKWNQKILDEYVFERIMPKSDVQVNGYTDILGTEEYNQKLSQNRADATKSVISGRVRGKSNSLVSKGYGKSAPLYTNDLPEGRYYNRTVQVLIETPIETQ